MKTLSKWGMMLALAGSLFLASCEGSYYVADQPVEPVYDRGVAPYSDAVWINGEWNWNGGRYAYTNGYWDHGRPGHTYVAGSWAHDGHGYRWNHGHWQ